MLLVATLGADLVLKTPVERFDTRMREKFDLCVFVVHEFIVFIKRENHISNGIPFRIYVRGNVNRRYS